MNSPHAPSTAEPGTTSAPEWTQDRVATLKAMWLAGQSARDIALALGVSRNAVIGKAHRERCLPRESPIRNPGHARVRREKSLSVVSEKVITMDELALREKALAFALQIDGMSRDDVLPFAERVFEFLCGHSRQTAGQVISVGKKWTDERKAILVEHYPAGTKNKDIVRMCNALPGQKVTVNQVSGYAVNVLKLRRSAGFESSSLIKARAAWTRKAANGVDHAP